MLSLAITLFIISLVAAIFGFTGIAAAVGGVMLTRSGDGMMLGYEAVGYLSCLFALASLWTAFKVRAVS